jgi:hypothetical protein
MTCAMCGNFGGLEQDYLPRFTSPPIYGPFCSRPFLMLCIYRTAYRTSPTTVRAVEQAIFTKDGPDA